MHDPNSEPRSEPPAAAAATPFDRLDGLSPTARGLLVAVEGGLRSRNAAALQRAVGALMALAPNHPEVLRVRAAIARLQGQREIAIRLLRAASATQPRDALVLANLAQLLVESVERDEALAVLERRTTLEPSSPAAWLALADARERFGDGAAALDAVRAALAIDPRNPAIRLWHARLLQNTGDIAAADAEYRAIVHAHPTSARAWFGYSTLRSARFDADALRAIESVHADPSLDENDRVAAGFARAKALEDNDRPADAFAVLVEANTARRKQVHWNAAAFSANARAIEDAFAAPLPEPIDPAQGREIIFLVGMPRSGSTLVEQMLGAHSQVAAAGELDDANSLIREESQRRGSDFPAWIAAASAHDWQRLGRAYLDRTARWRRERPRSTDKALLNWRYVGALRAMLPGAHFVDCRRDALETCLACFRQLFRTDLGFTYSLDELAAFHHDYDRSMRAWHARHGDYVRTVEHESLVANPESEIRGLLDFCELPFEEACLHYRDAGSSVQTASAAQVREPLRRDTARAHRYGDLLDALRQRLAAPATF